jgi:hypothetical protein
LLIAIALSTILAAPTAIPLPDAPAAWRPAVEKAQEAWRAFQKSLQARLAEAMSQGGPPAATLQPRVKEALAARYPGDRAVGYAVGDFRGFLWVEAAK